MLRIQKILRIFSRHSRPILLKLPRQDNFAPLGYPFSIYAVLPIPLSLLSHCNQSNHFNWMITHRSIATEGYRMNGQLIQLLLAMLLQTPGGEVFPSAIPNLSSPGFAGNPASSTQLPPNMRPIPDHIGWGTDRDNKFCIIIQIAPDKITEFARTARGQELSEDIPEEIRNRVQRVVFRVGNEPVERIPANPQSLADNRSSPNPTIMNLDGSNPSSLGTLTPIDKPRSPGIYTAAQGGPSFSGGGANFNNDQNVLPSTPNTNDYLDRTRALGNIPNTPGTSSFDNRLPANGSQLDVMPSAANPTRRDNFNAAQTKFPSILQPSNGTAPVTNGTYASNTPPFMPQQNNNSTFPQSNNSSATNNYNNMQNGFGPPNRTNLASNPTPPNFGYDPSSFPQNQQPSPSQTQIQQYGPPASQPNYSSATQYPNQPVVSFAQLAQMANAKAGAQQIQPIDASAEEHAKDKFLPFLLLVSIVGNVYLGLWMNHLRGRYRQLLSNMRGIPLSDIA